ncbi:MAG: glycosyltransferase, partial [Vicinamibacterales bacterium]
RVLRFEQNRGKAEAVRRGLRTALDSGAEIVGYLDADLSAPIDEIVRIASIVEPGVRDVVVGSRVLLLGALIQRSVLRHYLGRVFATAASLVLGIPVYDTQCGAKCFASHPSLDAALGRPFVAGWAFDVELLGRLARGMDGAAPVALQQFAEVPLRRWVHVGGSKVRPLDVPRMAIELLRIQRHLSSLERDARR